MGNFFTDVIEKDSRFLSKKLVSDPKLLEPNTRAAVEAIIADADAKGIKLMIYETYRSRERQLELFKKGASKLKKVGVHHYGLACDIVKKVNGKPSWKGDFSFLRDLAKAHGLIWGGDWGTPNVKHSFQDDDHVQRCGVPDQEKLFSGDWYPGDNYDPYKATAAAAKPKAAKPAKKKPAAKKAKSAATGN